MSDLNDMKPRIDRAKLKKIVGMMTSDNNGVAANAARAFVSHLESAGITVEGLAIGERRAPGDALTMWNDHKERMERAERAHRDDMAVANLRIAILESFVSKRVIEIANHQAEQERSRLTSLRVQRKPATYKSGAGGRAAWAKDKGAAS